MDGQMLDHNPFTDTLVWVNAMLLYGWIGNALAVVYVRHNTTLQNCKSACVRRRRPSRNHTQNSRRRCEPTQSADITLADDASRRPLPTARDARRAVSNTCAPIANILTT